MAEASTPDALMRHLDEAGGQGLQLDKLPFAVNIVTRLVRQGKAHISFGRLYATRPVIRRATEQDLA